METSDEPDVKASMAHNYYLDVATTDSDDLIDWIMHAIFEVCVIFLTRCFYPGTQNLFKFHTISIFVFLRSKW